MRKTKKVFTEKEEVYAVYCNMCGEEIQKDQFGNLCEYLSVDKEWGYLSSIDGQKHSFDLCDKCYRNIVENFKIRVLDEN